LVKSRLQDAGEKAEALLQRMKKLGLKPETITFNAAISAWANSNNPSAGQSAKLLLQKMLKLYEAGHVDVKPNTTSFNSAIAAWTNCRSAFAANKAEGILRRMLELSKQGNDDMHPNTFSYNSAIQFPIIQLLMRGQNAAIHWLERKPNHFFRRCWNSAIPETRTSSPIL
jgi:hypothetical protein